MSGDMRRLTTLTASCALLGFSVGYGVWQLTPLAGALVACHLVPPVVQRLRRARTTVDEWAGVDEADMPPAPCWIRAEGKCDGRASFCAGCIELGVANPDLPRVDELHGRRLARTRRDVRHG